MKYRIREDLNTKYKISRTKLYPYQIEFRWWGFWCYLRKGGFNTLIEARVELRLIKNHNNEIAYYYK